MPATNLDSWLSGAESKTHRESKKNPRKGAWAARGTKNQEPSMSGKSGVLRVLVLVYAGPVLVEVYPSLSKSTFPTVQSISTPKVQH